MTKRIFLIILDSFGIGNAPDANEYGDEGSNTLASISRSSFFKADTMKKLGLFNIDGVDCCEKEKTPIASFGRCFESSKGKDTTTGHWEICGVISKTPMPTYPNGFPPEVIKAFEKQTGRNVLCNLPYSGTKVIEDFGQEHIKTGSLIVYTSADSVFQIAAHEDIVPPNELYEYCKIARKILVGNHSVGRVIARPFVGDFPNFVRTSNRHDFSLLPPKKSLLDFIKSSNLDVFAIGKIKDIFVGQGITNHIATKNNTDGMNALDTAVDMDFKGLCFANLVDFDMIYGHRNDIDGYAKAISDFDLWLGSFLQKLSDDDMLIITADHGCDPATPSTDHSRESIPLLIYQPKKAPINLGTRNSFADIGKSIADILNINANIDGVSFAKEIGGTL
ncbi:MAG: phosphopentomutase [Clostridiales bacterium]|jgi:phosphopentomutase|nr:phosphopentomutase [Clostridiales bacterium]